MPAPPTYANPSTFGSKSSDLSVVLVTGSYDHEIRFWEAWSGICSRTIPRSGETGVRTLCHLLRAHRLTLLLSILASLAS